jgi:hypothetical protein
MKLFTKMTVFFIGTGSEAAGSMVTISKTGTPSQRLN